MSKDILTAKSFQKDWLLSLFKSADSMRKEIAEKRVLDYARGRFMVTIFLEPSTRTRLSFQFAMSRLGGEVIDFGMQSVSSIAKGETFEDTIRMVDGYGPDIIVLRDKEPGSALRAAELASAAVVNAGDGWNEHPTQALTDLYTMFKVFGKVDGLKVGIMGDLKHGRTPSSLSYALSKFSSVRIYFVAPPQMQIRPEVLDSLPRTKYFQCGGLDEVPDDLDVIYLTRLQKERLEPGRGSRRIGRGYSLSTEMLKRFPKVPIIMHPLPRVDELPTEIDKLPQAKYFDQAANGMFVRAALIRDIL